MRKNRVVIGFFCMLLFACLDNPAQADFLDVLNTISQTGHTITTVNRAGRSTMSTVEYAQRFTDRQQDRKDRKRAEKEYNANAEAEYYRTLQETESLRRNYYNSNL